MSKAKLSSAMERLRCSKRAAKKASMEIINRPLSATIISMFDTTYYIRHWPQHREFHPSRLDIQGDLYEKGQIAIHYEDIPSPDYEKYVTKPGRACIRRFANLAKNGAYVCAFYPAINKMLAGTVEPNTKMEVWDHSQDFLCVKSLQLSAIRKVPDGLALRWNAIAPQGTLYQWKAIGDKISRYVRKEKLQPSWSWLTVPEQETVCAEYLRSSEVPEKMRVTHLLLPVGRTLRDVDIFGITSEGEELFVQVTFSDDTDVLATKIDALCSHKSKNLVLISPTNPKNSDIFWIPTANVWNWLSKCSDFLSALFKDILVH